MNSAPPTMSSLAVVFLRRTSLALLAVLFVVYVGDLFWFHIRSHIPSFGAASGSIHRVRLLAIPGKANKTEYAIDAIKPEEDLPCAHSLFPHAGLNPCWYVARHAQDPIKM